MHQFSIKLISFDLIMLLLSPSPLLERLSKRNSDFVGRSKIDLDAAQVTDVLNYRYVLFFFFVVR